MRSWPEEESFRKSLHCDMSRADVMALSDAHKGVYSESGSGPELDWQADVKRGRWLFTLFFSGDRLQAVQESRYYSIMGIDVGPVVPLCQPSRPANPTGSERQARPQTHTAG